VHIAITKCKQKENNSEKSSKNGTENGTKPDPNDNIMPKNA
jgi:hypothetical protein